MYYQTFRPRFSRFWIIIVFLVTIMTACAPSTTPPRSTDHSCDWLQEPQLQALLFGEMTIVEFNRWLQHTYEIDYAEIKDTSVGNHKWITWQSNMKKYTAYFVDDNLLAIGLHWEEPYPTGKSFVNCFGAPEFYNTLYLQDIEARSLTIDLWYPKLGIHTGAYLLCRSNCPPPVDQYIGLEAMAIFKPGESVDEVLSYVYGDNLVRRDNILESLHPWPGNWSAIVVDEQPKLQ